MASFFVSLSKELQCSICLDVFTDPVTTPCGHNFCRTCLNKHWTTTQTCFCPVCKEIFSERPDLRINTTLREVVKHMTEQEHQIIKIIGLGVLLIAAFYVYKQHIEFTDPRGISDAKASKWIVKELAFTIAELRRRNSELELHAKQRCTTKDILKQNGLKLVQKYAVNLTLDPDSANPYLILSDDGKQVSHRNIRQAVPENPKRFEDTLSVLAKEGFSSGRFYYEVQVKGKTMWALGLARESVKRKEKVTVSPEDGLWTLALRKGNEYSALADHDDVLSLKVKLENVGVFVDYEEGLVSFYDVDSDSYIYSYNGQRFTDKLYPYFNPYLNDEGKNSEPLIITPIR